MYLSMSLHTAVFSYCIGNDYKLCRLKYITISLHGCYNPNANLTFPEAVVRYKYLRAIVGFSFEINRPSDFEKLNVFAPRILSQTQILLYVEAHKGRTNEQHYNKQIQFACS